ncbi:MAG: PAS domain-containing protein [bacterium]|nr:PAS domain-containing protein [bacterium]
MNGAKVVATASGAAFAVDAEGRMIAWNEAATNRLGYSSSDIVGRRCWTVLKGQDPAGGRFCAQNCPYIAPQEEPVNREQMLLRPIGEAETLFRSASGKATRVHLSTYVVQGESGKREIVHLI